MLGITKNLSKGAFRDTIRFYSNCEKIMAHKTAYGSPDIKLHVGYTDRDFDVYVNADEIKQYVKIGKSPEIHYNVADGVPYDGNLIFNGVPLHDIPDINYTMADDTPVSSSEPIILLNNSTLEMIRKAVHFTADDSTRPMFTHVFVNSECVVGTNTHFLYQGKHDMEGVGSPLFFPKEVIPFLAPGKLQTAQNKAKTSTRYRLEAEDREISWYVEDMNFPDYKRVIPKEETTIDLPADKRYLEDVNRLTIIAKVLDPDRNPIRLDKFLQCGPGIFNGRYVQIILKTLQGKPFRVNHCDARLKEELAPISFITETEIMVLTPIRLKDTAKWQYAE
jgi:hypothetical protein